uniref:Uncharacterized protein n=1 Tax=Anopheles christyi TaxID=43041 RepID=A0A182KIZ6_9DIPT
MINSDCFTAPANSAAPGPPAGLLLEGSFPVRINAPTPPFDCC